jgi:hypothetical protein
MILLNVLLFIRLINAERNFPLLTDKNQQQPNENKYLFIFANPIYHKMLFN